MPSLAKVICEGQLSVTLGKAIACERDLREATKHRTSTLTGGPHRHREVLVAVATAVSLHKVSSKVGPPS
jgi:hypothetical protein